MIEEFFICELCNTHCNSRSSLIKHNYYKHKIRAKDTVLNYCYNNNNPKCSCGCGEDMGYLPERRDFKKWKLGHSSRVKNNFNIEKAKENSRKTRTFLKEAGLLKGRDSEETRKRKSESHKGEKNHNYGKFLSKERKLIIGEQSKERWENSEIRNKIVKSCKEYWSKSENKNAQSYRRTKWLEKNPGQFQNTKLEQRFAELLDLWEVEYIRQYRIKNKVFDFFIKKANLIIETDGDFWHCNPKTFLNGPKYKVQKEVILNDQYKESLLKESNYKLIRIWESELEQRKEEIKFEIFRQINDTSETNNRI